ncbi:mandelate racemase muconate lactonizing enzyme family protein [Eremomyces bilateralis CBS 781.70]|uniref:Mandelate racemase muconate lactonizing enzyme family protein n=1 Tax=Eremomyces bilateralis CBS 781.70 TaxID=1392243 RepID=A0A6G1G5L5_9PEZI|nr:mandelate racemase muconate lactonizing enzyme family protein [Eremomyces bilateralis CBS 781.70]KAF1813385.1 mandelate racemase muconate lactonizing enzyme family protein [Eremomyces bilateralis CBS 781.70]
MVTITRFETRDVRFPTSLDKTGSDAMNTAGDYSAAYCLLYTDSEHVGHGMTFTIGRGNDIVAACIPYIAKHLVSKPLSSFTSNMGATWRTLTSDSQIRWIGPEKGVSHLALGAVVNALWDLWARVEGKPIWQLVADMAPEEVVRCIDFRYVEDAITPQEAVEFLRKAEVGKAERLEKVRQNRAVRCYTTSAGWLGYSKEKMRELLLQSKNEGFQHFKLKVGASVEEDIERLKIAREIIGDDAVLMVDANQIWSVPQAIEHMTQLVPFKPWFIEEPTSPDDILGHAAVLRALSGYGIGVATGEMAQNRVIFKQLLQARAITVAQPDACRLGGLNEVLCVFLLAAKFGVQCVPHSGGVGLPEYTQHMSIIDYVLFGAVGQQTPNGDGPRVPEERLLEYVEHLHEHYEEPAEVEDGYVVTPTRPGYSVNMKEESAKKYEFPGKDGVSWWRSDEAKQILDSEWV